VARAAPVPAARTEGTRPVASSAANSCAACTCSRSASGTRSDLVLRGVLAEECAPVVRLAVVPPALHLAPTGAAAHHPAKRVPARRAAWRSLASCRRMMLITRPRSCGPDWMSTSPLIVTTGSARVLIPRTPSPDCRYVHQPYPDDTNGHLPGESRELVVTGAGQFVPYSLVGFGITRPSRKGCERGPG